MFHAKCCNPQRKLTHVTGPSNQPVNVYTVCLVRELTCPPKYFTLETSAHCYWVLGHLIGGLVASCTRLGPGSSQGDSCYHHRHRHRRLRHNQLSLIVDTEGFFFTHMISPDDEFVLRCCLVRSILLISLRACIHLSPLYTGLRPSCHLCATIKMVRTLSGRRNPESSVSV